LRLECVRAATRLACLRGVRSPITGVISAVTESSPLAG